MTTSRSGAGGKIVANRRKQRLAATPYDRPPPQSSLPPPPKSPNWFTGVIVPSARALASGAGKILSSIFSESESSSSEDEDSASEEDIDNNNDHEYVGLNALNKENVTSSEMMQHGQESQLSVPRTDAKRIIEQLIMQETFSREECDRLIRVINSRVMDWSMEAGEKSLIEGSPGKIVDQDDVEIYSKAVLEAKQWFQEKKVGSSSMKKFAHGTFNLNSPGLEHVESGSNSPVDVARSYMKDRPPWASPTKNIESRTPMTTTMKNFKEGTLYSVGHDSSSFKKRNSLASGSWNIQEELRRVRSKATEDMLSTPSAKIDPSSFGVATSREESAGAGKAVSIMGERTTETESLRKTKPIDALIDAGVSADPALAALETRQDGKASEAPSSRPATSVSGNNEVSETVLTDGECAVSKFPNPSSPNHAEEHRTDPHLSRVNGPIATEVTEFGGRQSVNGLSTSPPSLSAEVATGQNNEHHDKENQNADTISEKKSMNSINVEGNCELLSEAYMEVPIVTETDSIASGSQNSLGIQNEERSLDIGAQPDTKGKVDLAAGKQQGRKPGKYSRRGRGRGK